MDVRPVPARNYLKVPRMPAALTSICRCPSCLGEMGWNGSEAHLAHDEYRDDWLGRLRRQRDREYDRDRRVKTVWWWHREPLPLEIRVHQLRLHIKLRTGFRVHSNNHLFELRYYLACDV